MGDGPRRPPPGGVQRPRGLSRPRHGHDGRVVRQRELVGGRVQSARAELSRGHVPRGERPAPRVVPEQPAHGRRRRGTGALQDDPHARVRAGRERVQDVQVARERDRPAARHRGREEPEARPGVRRRYPAAVGREHGLHLGRAHRNERVEANLGRVPQAPRHAAVSHGQHRRLRAGERRRKVRRPPGL